MGVLFIVNIPWTFSVVWSGIKPWLDARTKMKIRIYARGYETEMLSCIDSDELPPCYGGTGAALETEIAAAASEERTLPQHSTDTDSSGSEVSGSDDDFFDAPEGGHLHHGAPLEGQAGPVGSANAPAPTRGIGNAFLLNRCWQCTKSWDVRACERALCRVNAFFLVIGVLLITAGAIVHAQGVWSAELVEWAFWTTAGLIVLGTLVTLLSGMGFWGARNRSDAMLSAYLWALGVTALVQVVFSALCFAAAVLGCWYSSSCAV